MATVAPCNELVNHRPQFVCGYYFVSPCNDSLVSYLLSPPLPSPPLHRHSAPSHGFVLLNRLSSDNLLEMVLPGSEFRVQDQFVLFKKRSGITVCVCVCVCTHTCLSMGSLVPRPRPSARERGSGNFSQFSWHFCAFQIM